MEIITELMAALLNNSEHQNLVTSNFVNFPGEREHKKSK